MSHFFLVRQIIRIFSAQTSFRQRIRIKPLLSGKNFTGYCTFLSMTDYWKEFSRHGKFLCDTNTNTHSRSYRFNGKDFRYTQTDRCTHKHRHTLKLVGSLLITCAFLYFIILQMLSSNFMCANQIHLHDKMLHSLLYVWGFYFIHSSIHPFLFHLM